VLGLSVGLLRRKLDAAATMARGAAGSGGGDDTGHPSRFALDVAGTPDAGAATPDAGTAGDAASAAVAAHVSTCTRCRAHVDTSTRRQAAFEKDLAPAAEARVAAALQVERARAARFPRWRRALVMTLSFGAVAALAFAVARPREPPHEELPYRGVKTASRAKAAGILIRVRRGDELRPLAPDMALRPGDRLHFRVRAEGPIFLELRVRTAAREVRVFPASGTLAARVAPGEALDTDYVVSEEAARPGPAATGAGGASPVSLPRLGRVWIVGLFADQPFALDRPPGPDVEVVPVRADVEP